MNNDGSDKPYFKHLRWIAGGAFAGAWWVKNRVEESKKSRAERDDPEGVREVCGEIAKVLDEWKADDECETEDEFVYDLADYLKENIDWEVEVQPHTPHGKPTILVGDLLALELKLSPNKGVCDSVVGWCADYSKQWVTWIVFIEASPSLVRHLEALLIDKSLERILVWLFSYNELEA